MNKGFTLIELLGVIVILIIIFMVAVPAVTKVINNSEDTIYDVQITKILNAAYDYSLKNVSILPDRDKKNFITLSELLYNDYLDPVVNPKTGKLFPDDYLISIENVGTSYKSTDKLTKKSGDYLYKIELDLMKTSEYLTKKPLMYLENLDRTGDGYVSIIDYGDSFVEEELTIYDSEDNDITDYTKVFKNVFLNDELVSEVDTEKVGIYKINYVAIYEDEDSKVYASTLTWSIVISDKEKPTITLPSTNRFARYSAINLMSGVSCTDNTGVCTINYTGEVDTRKNGTYIIIYTATDESGNTATARRVITIY